MPAKQPSYLQLPVDDFSLSEADLQRAQEEIARGMVAPQHAGLHDIAKPVAPNKIMTKPIQELLERMLKVASDQQHASPNGGKPGEKRRMLVGLAAPQIGESVRIIAVDTKVQADRKIPGKLECFINPEIVWRSRETVEGREGCFSAGPVWGLVRRPVAVKIRAFDKTGKHVERIFEGFQARIACHEIDHLGGIRFPDRIKTGKKRHWVHTEELEIYPKHITHWPRICSLDRWEKFKGKIGKA